MAKIHIGRSDYSGGSAGWIDCWYHVDISPVKDADLDVSGGVAFGVNSNSKVINGKGRVILGLSRVPELISTHPDFIGGDFVDFSLTANFAAAVASLNSSQNSTALRQEFADNGALLSAAGVVSVVTASEEWSISDAGRTHVLTAIDTDSDTVNDAIAVHAEVDQSEDVLLAAQDLAEVSVQVRATQGESGATMRGRIEGLYPAIQNRTRSEYTNRFQYYGEELNP